MALSSSRPPTQSLGPKVIRSWMTPNKFEKKAGSKSRKYKITLFVVCITIVTYCFRFVTYPGWRVVLVSVFLNLQPRGGRGSWSYLPLGRPSRVGVSVHNMQFHQTPATCTLGTGVWRYRPPVPPGRREEVSKFFEHSSNDLMKHKTH